MYISVCLHNYDCTNRYNNRLTQLLIVNVCACHYVYFKIVLCR